MWIIEIYMDVQHVISNQCVKEQNVNIWNIYFSFWKKNRAISFFVFGVVVFKGLPYLSSLNCLCSILLLGTSLGTPFKDLVERVGI